MRKFTVVLLAALFMVAGTAYLISMTGVDKAEHQALQDRILSLKKAALGSLGRDGTSRNGVVLRRGRGRLRVVNNGLTLQAEGCPPCGEHEIVGTLAPDTTDALCLACCDDQFIKLDVLSERLGVPSDVALEVTDNADPPNILFYDDDGRGLSGVSTDACLIFRCPASGEYNVNLINLMDPDTSYSEDQSVYVLQASVLCDVEEEINDPGTPGDLNCEGFADGDGDEDEDGDGALPDEDEDGDWNSLVGEYGGEEGDVDCFTVCLRPGEVLLVNLDSAECDDILDEDQVDPFLTLEDENGNPVAFDDDTDDLDPNLAFRAPDLGNEYDTYVLCLADARLYNPGVYELMWRISHETAQDDINCALVGDGDEDEDGDEDQDYGPGHMETSGSSLAETDAKHGFKVSCLNGQPHQEVEINMPEIVLDGQTITEVKFKTDESVDGADTQNTCFDDPNVEPDDPTVPFDRIVGFTIGTLDKGIPGVYRADYAFRDGGKTIGLPNSDAGCYQITAIEGPYAGQVIYTSPVPPGSPPCAAPSSLTLLDKGNHKAKHNPW